MNQKSELDQLRIATPCRADWKQMAGDDRVRFCAQCERNVYNLSGMTRAEAEQLFLQSEGRVCARIYRRFDGTVITRDCPVGLRSLRRQVAALVGCTLLMVAFIASGLLTAALNAGFQVDSNRSTKRRMHWPAWMWQQRGGPEMGDCMIAPPPVNTGSVPAQSGKSLDERT